jgi:hypothetical protein
MADGLPVATLTPAAHLLLYRIAIRERAARMLVVEAHIRSDGPRIASESMEIHRGPRSAAVTHKQGSVHQNGSSRKIRGG